MFKPSWSSCLACNNSLASVREEAASNFMHQAVLNSQPDAMARHMKTSTCWSVHLPTGMLYSIAPVTNSMLCSTSSTKGCSLSLGMYSV